jgi:hypothetical protein
LKVFIIISVLANLVFGQTSEPCRLTYGTYKVSYDQEEYQKLETEFIVSGDSLTIDMPGNRESFKINWLTDSSFDLETSREGRSQKTDISKELGSLGTPFYQLSNCTDKRIRFELKRNMHITISSGTLHRIK